MGGKLARNFSGGTAPEVMRLDPTRAAFFCAVLASLRFAMLSSMQNQEMRTSAMNPLLTEIAKEASLEVLIFERRGIVLL